MKHSLLEKPLIRVRLSSDGGEEVRVFTLPQVLHALAQTNDLLSFEALQAHQRQAWYCFLVQLAAMAVARGTGGQASASQEGWRRDDWRRALLNLSGGNEAAWHLVVEDVQQPAFMQPPVPHLPPGLHLRKLLETVGSGQSTLTQLAPQSRDVLEAVKSEQPVLQPLVLEGLLDEADFFTVAEHVKKGERSLDSFEPLLTSKNHSVKRQRVTDPQPDHWIYALCNTQTMSGYVNYYQRIARVSGGYSSRPLIGLTLGLTWEARFQRDLNVLLDARSALDRYDAENGHALLWLHPWSGEKDDAIPLEKCDPYFIEVSRRVRLVPDGDRGITYRKGTNPGMRIEEPPDLDGVTGDVWTPITGERKALRIAGRGFHYRLLKDVLLGADYERPPALEFRRGEGGHMYLVAEALGRGQGKTYGLHQRIVPIPPEIASRLPGQSGTLDEELAERSRERIGEADAAKNKVLYAALTTLLLAGQNQKKKGDDEQKQKSLSDGQKRMRRHQLNALDRAIDAVFFESLWASVGEGVTAEEARRQWHTLLWERAERQFEDAQGHAPSAAIHRWRARSAARSVFDRQANRYLKHADQVRFSPVNAPNSNPFSS